jgi:hypothetical protein
LKKKKEEEEEEEEEASSPGTNEIISFETSCIPILVYF